MSPDGTVSSIGAASPVKGMQGVEGHIGSLIPHEERSLQEAWVHLLRLSAHDESKNHPTPDMSDALRKHLDGDSITGFRLALWNLFLSDHPDVMVLRFLRARRWDVEKAMEMLVSNMQWRHEHQVDEEIVAKGDSVVLIQKPTKAETEMAGQFRSGKAYIRSTDKEGRPIFHISVKLHLISGQSVSVMEDFVIHQIETVKTMMRYPIEKVCLIFDLTGFGLRNMDFNVVRFLATTFEARYPEYLGVVLIHNAPFVFWGEWYQTML